MLGRVKSPGFHHTAVMLGCEEPSEAAPVANTYRNTAHTRRHIPIGGYVAGEGGVAYIAAHSSPTRWRGVALPEKIFVDGGVMCSFRCSRDRKYLSRERNKLFGDTISCKHLLEHDSRRLILCLGGWSRLDSITQQLCWVAWSPRRLHLLPTSIGIYFRLKLVLRG